MGAVKMNEFVQMKRVLARSIRSAAGLARWATAVFALAAMSACGGGSGAPSSASDPSQPIGVPAPTPVPPSPPSPQAKGVKLPIEVLGPAGYMEAVEFELADAGQVQRLSLQCHRCGWRDGTVRSGKERGAKASVRLNGGAWTDITDAAVEMQAAERAYGGLSGGFLTTRFSLPIQGAVSGKNTLEFRFNKADGFSSGYRILAVNLLDASGQALLPASSFVNDDPTQWRVAGTAADVAEGQALWSGKVALTESPLSTKVLKASCASCHAADGRDLKYFNYSDWSVQVRSQFHGLSELQGKQIAAYVRSLSTPAPAQARPWNPPYQPGPGLDAKPVEEWAAGAGLSAVLDKDSDMLKFLFPNASGTAADTSTANLKRVMDTTKSLNIREMPVAVQLPDWNSWLPEVHPIDVWGDKFEAGPGKAYKSTQGAFSARSTADLLAAQELIATLNQVNTSVRDFVSAGVTVGVPSNEDAGSEWRTGVGDNIDIKVNGYDREFVKLSIAQWSAVKQWELAQQFGLEGLAPQALPKGGELRAWPTSGQSVHPLAAHITGDNIGVSFAWHSKLVGKYFSTAWYQLQMTLNAGQKQAVGVQPQDWPYQFKHIQDLSDLSGVKHPGRFVQSLIKAYQMRDNGVRPGGNGWQFRVTHPMWLHSDLELFDTSLWDALDGYEIALGVDRGLKKRIRTELAAASLGVTRSFKVSAQADGKIGDWLVCKTDAPKAPESWHCLQRQDFPITPLVPSTPKAKIYDYPGPMLHANNFAVVMRYFKNEKLIEDAVRFEYIDWLSQAWPAYDWEQFR
jgi:hypothetical protein